jgi:hypothetical protein
MRTWTACGARAYIDGRGQRLLSPKNEHPTTMMSITSLAQEGTMKEKLVIVA